MRESSSAGAGSPEEGVLALGGQARLLAGTDLELATVEGGSNCLMNMEFHFGVLELVMMTAQHRKYIN